MRFVATLVMLGVVHTAICAEPAKDAERFARWEKDIAVIEKRLKDNPPEKGSVFFAGSSTIRHGMWRKRFRTGSRSTSASAAPKSET
jgi:hypothetical protein